MQPYYFPYIGYFQLIQAVDKFVLYDDVNFIKKGWVNRNNILAADGTQRITLCLHGASQNKNINEIQIVNDFDKLKKTISHVYSKAPNFSQVYGLLLECVDNQEQNLASFLLNSIRMTCDYLGINTKILSSSQLNRQENLSGQSRILDICDHLYADTYINAAGGKKLYDNKKFKDKGIDLFFISANDIKYHQFSGDCKTKLSILDTMMFCDLDKLKCFLDKYSLDS